MIPNKNGLMLFKFSENQWIDEIIKGNLSFSCAGAFVHQAKATGNVIQGDLLEAVFARCKKDDPTINRMKLLLGSDLEIIDKEKFVYLRRKSARFKPIFCLYAITAEDVLQKHDSKTIGIQQIRLDFDDRMFNGFNDFKITNVLSRNRAPTILFLQPKPFVDKIDYTMNTNNIPYKMSKIKYIDMDNDFLIEPNSNYDELGYKSKKFEYQHEVRVWLLFEKFTNIFERKSIQIGSLKKEDYEKTHKNLYLIMNVDIQQNNEVTYARIKP